MKAIATHRTYDPDDIKSTGWLFELYPNGRLAATYRTRWKGSRTNQRYITEPGYLTLADSLYTDHKKLLSAWVSEEVVDLTLDDSSDWHNDDWRKVRNGYIVR